MVVRVVVVVVGDSGAGDVVESEVVGGEGVITGGRTEVVDVDAGPGWVDWDVGVAVLGGASITGTDVEPVGRKELG